MIRGYLESHKKQKIHGIICQNSEHGYALATTKDPTYGNIETSSKAQTGETPTDCFSNIYDILGNCAEWTTEYSNYTVSSSASTCVTRRGHCGISDGFAAGRGNNATEYSYIYISFRLSLYE